MTGKARNIFLSALRVLFGSRSSARPGWPNQRQFALTIIDDTDQSTVANVSAVYELLDSIGMKTTKTVWVRAGGESGDPDDQGDSLADKKYREFIASLSSRGFEIALHGVKGGSSLRSEVLGGLEEFREIVGDYPAIHINHAGNRENLYWGAAKFRSRILRGLYGLTSGDDVFEGHVQGSDYFWGDICQRHIKYVADFSYHETDTLSVNPLMPNSDSRRNYVNAWFQTSDGGNVGTFLKLLSSENLDRLQKSGGACLVYTHFGKGFCKDGVVIPEVEARLRDLAGRNGWFVPAAELLDFLRGDEVLLSELTRIQRMRLQLRWLAEKIAFGSS